MLMKRKWFLNNVQWWLTPILILSVLLPGAVSPMPVLAQIIGSLSGTVFVDANRNNRIDDGEQAVAGVHLTLRLAANNQPVMEALSDTRGKYVFWIRQPNQYRITYTLPGISRYIW
jgi:hypothetical protein